MNTTVKPPLYLIDAYAQIYRSYFAFLTNPLRNAAGKNVSSLHGFARTIVTLLDDGAPAADENGKLLKKTEKPLCMAAVFDSRTPTFRHEMYSDYKANRQKTPDDLHEQVPLVEEFLTKLGIHCLKAEGFEADDIIATLAEKCRREQRQCYIFSSDKDLLQLVGKGIYEVRSAKNYKGESGSVNAGSAWELIGSDEVKAEWGVEPAKVLDLLSLAGDASDNIPGVKGIGEKTAAKLMARYGSLDEIYKNIAAIEGSTGKKIAEGRKNAYFSQSLIRLRDDVELSVSSIDDLKIENLNRTAGAFVLMREGIRQSAKQLDANILTAANPVNSRVAASNHDNTNTSNLGSANKSNPGFTDTEGNKEKISLSTADESLFGEGKYKTILDIKELKSLLNEAKKQKLLAMDFETDSLDAWKTRPVGISFALKPKEAFYVPIAPHGVNKDSGFIDPAEVRELLSPVFADEKMTIVAHNAKFDYKVSRGWGIARWKCKIWDTMTAAWLTDPERSNYSLDSLVSYLFDCTPVKFADIVPKGAAFDSVPLETAAHYSCEDADFCIRLKNHLEPILKKTESENLFNEMEMPLLPILAEMEGEGIKIDPKALIDFGRELNIELDKIQEETWKLAGHEFNLSSTKQLQEVLFVERKLNPGKKTKTGYSTDAEALEELAREDPVPALILRHRTLSKLKSTYVDSLVELADSEGRIHTSFIQTGTATGRLSSREPNMQNIPIRTEEGRRIREAFIAKPGHILISADYSQIELVVLAHLSQDKNLVAAFKENRDVHTQTASLIFGINESKRNIDSAAKLNSAGQSVEISREQRRMAKIINFGVIYGMSAFRLANELNISRTDAQKFIGSYFDTYSGVKQFIEELIQKTEQCGFVTTISGRRRYIPAINSRNKTEKSAAERITVNTPIQGSAADIVKKAMINLDKRLEKERLSAVGCKTRLLLQVHDELVFECPQDECEKTALMIKTEMEQAAELSIPLRVTVKTGSSWGMQ